MAEELLFDFKLESQPHRPVGKVTIRELLRTHTRSLVLGIIAAAGSAIASLLDPWPLKVLLHNVLRDNAINNGWLNHLIFSITGGDKLATIRLAAMAVMAIALIGAFCSYSEKLLTTRVGQWVTHDLRQTLYFHIQRMSLADYDRNRTGDLPIGRATTATSMQSRLSLFLLCWTLLSIWCPLWA